MKSLFILRFLLLLWVVSSADDDDEGSLATCDAPSRSSDCKQKSWIDEMGKNTEHFLREKVFGQPTMRGTKQQQHQHFLSHMTDEESSKNKPDENPFMMLLDRLASDATSASPKEKVENDMVGFLIEKSKTLIQEEQGNIDGLEFLSIIQDAIGEAAKQLTKTFGDIMGDINPSIAISLLYYMALEDGKKNPTWKRRQHRFFNRVSKALVLELHDALYLSQLAYSNSLEDFRNGLENFQHNSWELVFGTTESTPTMPSHFLLIHKNISPLKDPVMSSLLPWESLNGNEIEVTLVIRGTKHLSDIISDALLEPAEYMDGYAHSGILASGKELAKKYSTKLKELLEHSGRNKIRLNIVGHSLGAGAGAVAAVELHGLDFLSVEAVGFGCPSLLSEELSLSTKDYITTVVTDADIIPRMSGSSAMNQLLDLLEFNWADAVLDDMQFSLARIRDVLPFGDFLSNPDAVINFSKDFITKEIKPKLGTKKYERVDNVLIPPGNCIHFFRDGVGFTGTFTPCSFFRETDLVRTLVDDHLVMPGYHRALVTFMRDLENDYNFDFVHDIASLPV